jgi:RNA polymerase sigma-70 factor, ECF subfamily
LLLLLCLLLPALLLPARLLPSHGTKAGIATKRQMLLTPVNSVETTDDHWHALGDELRAFLRSRVSNDADADDLTQEVFLRVVENRPSLRDAERIQSWVYQIARNAIVDFYRRRSKHSVQYADVALEVAQDENSCNQNLVIGRWLLQAVEQLPETLRDAVRMYEIEGLPQSDIAQRLSLSLSGAKSRIQRGRDRLEDMLGKCCALERDRRGNVIECKPNTAESCAESACECQTDGAHP